MNSLLDTAVQNDFQLRVAAARFGDIEAYAKAVHGMQIEPYQMAWDMALETGDRTVIVCPPGSFKSTTVQFWVERAIARNPDIRILWVMNSGTQSERRVTEVGRTITHNRVYQAAFPKVKPDPDGQWSKTSLYVERTQSHPDPTLFGSGWDGPYQGLHCHVIVLDDLTDQKDVYSATTMDMQRQKLRGVIRNRLERGGRIVAIMTRWGDEDLLREFISMDFRVIVMPVISPDYPWGPTLSNNLYPMNEVELLRRDSGDALFQMTYQCDPQSSADAIIKRNEIKYWDEKSLPQSACYTVMACDPASSQKSWADYSCIGIGLVDPTDKCCYVTDVWCGRLQVPDLEKEIVRRATRTSGLIALGLETVGFQTSLMQSMKRNYQLPIVELPYRTKLQVKNRVLGLDRDKTSRAYYLASQFSASKIRLHQNPKAPMPLANFPLIEGVSLETELTRYGTPLAEGSGKHDDRSDVLSFLTALADAYGAPRPKITIRGW